MSQPDTYQQLQHICLALDKRFPDGNDVFQRVTRLCEESGELASAVNHIEGSGVKRQKHGDPDYANLVKEIQDVMRCAMGIAIHYGVQADVTTSIDHAYKDYLAQGYIERSDVQ